ncbi:MAG: FixH family protein [Saprospiraceae bacterium]|nr:FixH family protein [Saprospiraceae bacterium]
MKINWGSGIAIFYTAFVIAMLSMVYMSTQNKSHLVQENYYKKDLNYEAFRLKRQNAANLEQKLDIQFKHSDNAIALNFPPDMLEAQGKVSLFRPSDKYQDVSYELNIDSNGAFVIPVEKGLKNGLWTVKVDWASGDKEYYQEESIVL